MPIFTDQSPVMADRYIVTDIDFTVNTVEQRIDSFDLPTNEIQADGFNVIFPYVVNRRANWPEADLIDDYITGDLLEAYAKLEENLTFVIDLQVGRGKSQSCYELMERYSKEDNKVIFVLSPFRKLVEKDFAVVHNRMGISAFNYESLKAVPSGEDYTDILNEAVTKKVHIMTVNCLLGNPGEDSFDQSKIKRDYLDALLKYCQEGNRKVIMFYDEIHEAIDNFAPQFIPNLMKWKNVVQKCFVSSATFTAEAYPVVKFIALLTKRNIMLLSLPRIRCKSELISRLHLHIVGEEYNSKELAPLQYLKEILKDSKGKQVNILTGTKALAYALLAVKDGYGKVNPFFEYIAPFNFNVLTQDRKNEFWPTGNNIGTSFKTGVNITKRRPNAQCVYVIIFPVVSTKNSSSIFNDGIPSIVQAIGRQRTSGDIHIFMYEPTHLIEPDPNASYTIKYESDTLHYEGYKNINVYTPLAERLPAWFTKDKKVDKFKDQYTSITQLRRVYEELKEEGLQEIDGLMEIQNAHGVKLGYQYPTFEEFIMERGHNALVKSKPQFGSDLSSYVLWASLNDQFCNAQLTSIKYHERDIVKLYFVSGNMVDSLMQVIPTEVLERVKNLSVKEAHELIQKSIGSRSKSTNGESGSKPTVFYLDGKKVSHGSLFTSSLYLKAELEVIAYAYTLSTINIKATYILHSIKHAVLIMLKEKKLQKNFTLVGAYQRLYGIRQDFLEFTRSELVMVKANDYIIHLEAKDKMPIKIAKRLAVVAFVISTNDLYVKYSALSFLQDIEGKEGEELRDTAYRELRNIFTNISTDRTARRSFNNEVKKYAPVVGELEKPLPEVPFLYYL